MKEPSFWRGPAPGVAAMSLSPAAWLVSAVAARRAAREGEEVGVPVLCCGNATAGGAGKTTVALDLLARLAARGLHPHALTRGHGGRAHRARRVDQPDAALFGDEALLLARVAPTWAGADRAASAHAAIGTGADILVMDDGLQNTSLRKTASFLVVDGPSGFGNGLVMPAGPLREPPLQALRRCRAVILIGEDRTGALRHLRGTRPILRARLRQGPEVERLTGRPVVAFAGIARPAKFFDGLAEAGVTLAARVAFPDHHRFRPSDLRRLLAARDDAGHGAVLATTEKDAVRLPPTFRPEVTCVSVCLEWQDDRLDRILDAILAAEAPR